MSYSWPYPKELIGVRISTADILAATNMSPHALNNCISKSGLILCSNPLGQGRSREYCVPDAYQLALYSNLVTASGNVKWSVDNLNRILFGDESVSGFRSLFKKSLVDRYGGFNIGPIGSYDIAADNLIQEYRGLYLDNIVSALTKDKPKRPHRQFYIERDTSSPWYLLACASHGKLDDVYIAKHGKSRDVLKDGDYIDHEIVNADWFFLNSGATIAINATIILSLVDNILFNRIVK